MDHAVDRLQRFAVKLYLDPAGAVAPPACIEVFHGWIREGAVPGMLIDVADCTHLAGGPRVVLVAHEANYALDDGDGRMGLVYTCKQPLEGSLPQRLAAAAGSLLAAAERLERDTSGRSDGGATFLRNEIAAVANDRLTAPRIAGAEAAFREALATFGARLFDRAPVEIRPLDGPGRLGFTLRTADAAPLATLASRVR